MIYSQFGVKIVGLRPVSKEDVKQYGSHDTEGLCMAKRADGSEATYYRWELKADGGLTEIETAIMTGY